jgi:hypothetical protein
MYKPAPDPEWRSFAKVLKVEGTVLELEGGRRVELGGIDLTSLTPEERSVFEQNLRQMVIRDPVLAVPLPGGDKCWAAVSARASGKVMEGFYCPLFAKVVYLPPDRCDVGLSLVNGGLAPIRAQDLPEDRLRMYREAEDGAKARHQGIWATRGSTRPIPTTAPSSRPALPASSLTPPG